MDIKTPTNRAKTLGYFVLAIIALIVIARFSPVTSIPNGMVGVTSLFGKVDDSVLDAGIHLINPLKRVTQLDIRSRLVSFDNQQQHGDQTEGSSLFAATRDLQDVQIAVSVNYRIPTENVVRVYTQYQIDYESAILSPLIRESVKSQASQYTAEELVTKRLEFSDKVAGILEERFSEAGFGFQSFRVTNLEFSKEFAAAIEAKATAVQKAEAEKNKLEQVKYEAQQQIEQAKAQAETIRIQAEAINKQGGAEYVKLKAIEKWDGKLPTQLIPGSTVPFIDINR